MKILIVDANGTRVGCTSAKSALRYVNLKRAKLVGKRVIQFIETDPGHIAARTSAQMTEAQLDRARKCWFWNGADHRKHAMHSPGENVVISKTRTPRIPVLTNGMLP